MTTTVSSFFNDAKIANKVKAELIEAGCRDTDFEIFSAEDGDGELANKVEDILRERDFDEEKVRSYADQVRSGKVLVTARVEDDLSDRVVELMERYENEPVDVEEAEGSEEEEQRSAGAPSRERAQSSETTPIVEEEFKVGKKTTGGNVKARRVVRERPVEETVELREETAEVERRPADRKLRGEEKDQAFKEATIEMPETREEAIVSKEARVVGEVELKKDVKKRRETIKDKVRRADVEVEKSEPKAKKD